MFGYPDSPVIDRKGFLYVSDSTNIRIRKISPDGHVSTLAGCGQRGYKNGKGSEANFKNPSGIVLDEQEGSLYVCDTENHRVRKVSLEGDVSDVAGGTEGRMDGMGSTAQFSYPRYITQDLEGHLWVTDDGVLRKIV